MCQPYSVPDVHLQLQLWLVCLLLHICLTSCYLLSNKHRTTTNKYDNYDTETFNVAGLCMFKFHLKTICLSSVFYCGSFLLPFICLIPWSCYWTNSPADQFDGAVWFPRLGQPEKSKGDLVVPSHAAVLVSFRSVCVLCYFGFWDSSFPPPGAFWVCLLLFGLIPSSCHYLSWPP